SEAPRLQHAGTEILEHHVAEWDELLHDLLSLRLVEIERHHLLAAIVDRKPVRRAVLTGTHAAEIVAASRHLGLDDFGAELRHQGAAERTGDDLREFEHADAVERPPSLRH